MNNKKFILYPSLRHLLCHRVLKMRTIFFLTVILILAQLSGQGYALTPIEATQTHNNKDLIITSDSKAYCTHLNDHLTTILAKKPHLSNTISSDITHLQQEGNTLCAHNHVRSGIERLRRALYILKHSKDTQK